MTTAITHHLTDDLLMAHSAGALPEAFDLAVATHLSLCDECRARLGAFDGVGGAVLDAQAAEPLADDALARCMARIEAAPLLDDTPVPPRPAGTLPAPLAAFLGTDEVDQIRWRGLGGGVKQAVIDTAPDATARLLLIPGGMAMPDHGHRGLELTMVLQGAYADEDGRFARGDIEVADIATQHIPVAEPGEDCICLAVTDAPLRFKRWLPRLAQPFLGI